MRLTKETAKDRIEVAAVPVRNNIEKTVHKTFLEFQTLSAENLICDIHICIHDMGVLRSFYRTRVRSLFTLVTNSLTH